LRNPNVKAQNEKYFFLISRYQNRNAGYKNCIPSHSEQLC
jgi:hypothetical protein